MTEDEMVGITDSMDMSLSKLWELVMDRGGLEKQDKARRPHLLLILPAMVIKPVSPQGNQP